MNGLSSIPNFSLKDLRSTRNRVGAEILILSLNCNSADIFPVPWR